jgi:hypothetical protein
MDMIKRNIFLAVIICAVTTYAEAVVLPVNATRQEQTQWCWASSTQAIVRWLGGNVNQCTLADELRVESGWGYDQCCSYGFRTLQYPGYVCNQPNNLFYPGYLPVEQMLLDRDIDTTPINGTITQNAVQTEVNAGRPFIFRWGWDTGGGHFLVCHGQQGTYTHYFDPGPLANNFQVNTYNWVVDGATHTWTHTLRTDESPNPPIPDIKVNGSDGSYGIYYASPLTNLSITVNLTDGLYAGTQADWWVMGYFPGVYLYLNQSGNWTTIPSTWSQSDLVDRSSVIFSGTLGIGQYTIYFGVDLTRDGVMNDPMYYDYITIVVF